LNVQLQKVGAVFLTHREVSAQEAAYRILSMPMKQLSRQVVFLNVNSPQKHVAVLKSDKLLSTLDDSDENVFQNL